MNLNYLFNVHYFKDMDKKNSHMSECNKQLIHTVFSPLEISQIEFCEQSFTLKTLSPGLLLGLGNAHDSKGDNNDAIKLGYSIDYVTGLPLIPGSTVKGVLRSAFERYPEYVQELLGLESTEAFEQAKMDIFHRGDIFLDAVPIQPGKESKLYGMDTITPHKAQTPEMEGLVNPVPLTMLKVIPNVVYVFRFVMASNDSASRLNCFKELLCLQGIGAKTNVGFGAFEPIAYGGPFKWLGAATSSVAEPKQVPVNTPLSNRSNNSAGKCGNCGKATQMNPKTNKYHYLCRECNTKRITGA